jgi:pyridoxal phosphate-dependent aminotransferase EpsN
MPEPCEDYSNRWLSIFIIDPSISSVSVKDVIKSLSLQGIEARHLWKPMHQQPVFIDAPYFSSGQESYCDYLFDNGICLPSSSSMSIEHQEIVIKELLDIFL